jgi:predicted extracellular nuclease
MLGGRDQTRPKRERQAQAVMEIVSERFGPDPGEHPFAILGDLNDYVEEDEQGTSGIAELVGWEHVENVVERLPTEERWTHYFPRDDAYHQLDYLLLSRTFAEAHPGDPEILRKGSPLRAERYTGERFVGVGRDKPKASDHCPVLIELSGGA